VIEDNLEGINKDLGAGKDQYREEFKREL